MGESIEGDAMNEHSLSSCVGSHILRRPMGHSKSCQAKRSRGVRSESHCGRLATLRETVGPVGVICEENGLAELQQHAIVERAIWPVQSLARKLVQACQQHHRVKQPLTHTFAHFLNRSQRAAKDNRTAHELRRATPYRRNWPPFG